MTKKIKKRKFFIPLAVILTLFSLYYSCMAADIQKERVINKAILQAQCRTSTYYR